MERGEVQLERAAWRLQRGWDVPDIAVEKETGGVGERFLVTASELRGELVGVSPV